MNIKLLEKIQKLLALSESSNIYEAESAMLKAQELLAKHKLSLQEVKTYKVFSGDIKEKKSNVTFTKGKWKSRLAETIAVNFGCYHFFKTRHTHTITFFGREEDVIVCNIVLEYAVSIIAKEVKRLRSQYLRYGYSTKGLENDYAMGFIEGIKKKFEEQKQNNNGWALVLVRDSEVVEAYSNKKFNRSIDTNIQFQGYDEAFQQGYEEGNRFSISDRVTSDEDAEILQIVEQS